MTGGSILDHIEPDPEVVAAIARLQARVQCFVNDMREQGIHVGFGTPGRCVTCGEVWPCGESSDAD